jgi:hypothetical protein
LILLQPETFIHKALQARPIDQIVGELFVREHAERGAAGIGGHLGRLLPGVIGVLAEHGHNHAHHDLQPAEPFGFFCALVVLIAWLFSRFNFHTCSRALLDVDGVLSVAPQWPLCQFSFENQAFLRRTPL